MNGYGKIIWKNNKSYEGEFEDDQSNGFGVLKYPSGKKYIGY